MAAKFRKGIDLTGQKAINGGDPSAATDLATKQYVDQVAQGLTDLKDPVRATSTGAITLSGTQTVDGVALDAGDRFLYQHGGADNGIYVVAAGAWARSTDANASDEVTRGLATTVLEGTTKGTGIATSNPVTFVLTTANPIVLGTTALTFAPIGASSPPYVAGSGLTESPANTFNVGAGAGISVAADAVAVDTAVVARIYQADSVATTNPQSFTHGLGKRPLVQVVTPANDEVVYPDLTITTTTITVDWGAAPAASEYRVLAVG